MEKLEKVWKDGELKLFPYQVTGVETMLKWLDEGHGGINADEMGLGKTCQTVVMLTRQFGQGKGPFLVVAPLSVCDHWEQEVTRFSGGTLSPLKFTGHEGDRLAVYNEATIRKNTVFITAPHILIYRSTLPLIMKQQDRFPFSTMVIDEAQSIKNQATMLARTFKEICNKSKETDYILLTGTPIQNNLAELYSLLNFADAKKFPNGKEDSFVAKYSDTKNIGDLKDVMKVYMMRRTKEEVFSRELEKCEQVLLYHGVSATQKDIYKGIISKNAECFNGKVKNKLRMTNILMQLRKCVNHPYLFEGVEAEPFIEGEHIVEASGKLQVLDRLLKYIVSKGHRCLLFSQFLGALDIVEDLLRLRGWGYERLDGTYRVESRAASIGSFQKKTAGGPVCFLLTTKAGGVGLNLTAADTVIFLDSDWNPQADIQAMARCHRIGQKKTVRVIRLVARYTVDHYVVARARDKLKLTDSIMDSEDSKLKAADFVKTLKENFGLLMESDETNAFDCSDADLENIIGGTTSDGHWEPLTKKQETFLLNPDECDEADVDKTDFLNFKGVNYRDQTKTENKWWEDTVENQKYASDDKENKRKRKSRAAKMDSLSPQPRYECKRPRRSTSLVEKNKSLRRSSPIVLKNKTNRPRGKWVLLSDLQYE